MDIETLGQKEQFLDVSNRRKKTEGSDRQNILTPWMKDLLFVEFSSKSYILGTMSNSYNGALCENT